MSYVQTLKLYILPFPILFTPGCQESLYQGISILAEIRANAREILSYR